MSCNELFLGLFNQIYMLIFSKICSFFFFLKVSFSKHLFSCTETLNFMQSHLVFLDIDSLVIKSDNQYNQNIKILYFLCRPMYHSAFPMFLFRSFDLKLMYFKYFGFFCQEEEVHIYIYFFFMYIILFSFSEIHMWTHHSCIHLSNSINTSKFMISF